MINQSTTPAATSLCCTFGSLCCGHPSFKKEGKLFPILYFNTNLKLTAMPLAPFASLWAGSPRRGTAQIAIYFLLLNTSYFLLPTTSSNHTTISRQWQSCLQQVQPQFPGLHLQRLQ